MYSSGHILGLVLSMIAVTANGVPRCASIEDDTQRLRCYDVTNDGDEPLQRTSDSMPAPTSPWEKHILEDATRKPFTLATHRSNYVLFTHLTSINLSPYRGLDTVDRLERQEVKFQLSARTKLLDDVLFGNGDVWFGYSQTAYWQALSPALSSPVREINYEPELHLSFLTDLSFAGITLRNFDVGVVHQSNGRGDPLSRSWNRAVADVRFLADAWSFDLRYWSRLKGDPDEDDNPDILEYFGHHEVRTSWRKEDHALSLTLRNVFSDLDRYGAELRWTFPLTGRLRGMVQLYSGYGENLIDYDHANHRIGVGIVLHDGD